MHIKQITCSKFFDQGSLTWNLKPDVNFLVGLNRSGKTTLLNAVAKRANTTALGDICTVWENLPETVDILHISQTPIGFHDLKILYDNVRHMPIDASTHAYIANILSNFGTTFEQYLENKVPGFGESLGEVRMIQIIFELLLHKNGQPIIIDLPELGLDLDMQGLLVEHIQFLCS